MSRAKNEMLKPVATGVILAVLGILSWSHIGIFLNKEVLWRDVRPVLEEELARLPAKYRVPLVLCHLEGQTHEEVARRLGCPRDTVTTRLTRARARCRLKLMT